MILVLMLYALLASTFTLGKMLLYFLPPFYLIGVRMSIAGMLLLSFYYLNSERKVKPTLQDWFMLAGLSVIHILIPYTTEFIALQSVAPSNAALLYNLSPFFAALFSFLLLGEVMTLRKWVGFAIGFAGIIYFIDPATFELYDVHNSYLLLLVSVVSATLGWVLVRMLVTKRHFSPLFINGTAMLLGGLQSFILSSLYHELVVVPWGNMTGFLFLLIAVILIANVLFYNLYGYLLKRYTATFLSFVGFVTPLFTALYDWLFLSEQVRTDFFITIAIVGCGIYIFYKEELRLDYKK